MVGNVLTWQETLAQDPTAVPLRRVLADCLERILGVFQRYVSELVSRELRAGSEKQWMAK
jgi:hypothetical protein